MSSNSNSFFSVKLLFLLSTALISFCDITQAATNCLANGMNNINPDNINAHGGNILKSEGHYYWFGEAKGEGWDGNKVQDGINVYVSNDLCHWTSKGVAYAAKQNKNIIYLERPKVIFNDATKKYIMWFHIDFYKGYEGNNYARIGVASSNNPLGPYKYINSFRPNKGVKPLSYNVNDLKDSYFKKGIAQGFDSRDFTLFKDTDGKAYVIYNSEMNNTLHVAQLDETYTKITNIYDRILINGRNEAPVIFKNKSKYYLITSGLTGWKPNKARLYASDSIFGPWKGLGSPIDGNNSERSTTFNSQSAFYISDSNNSSYIFGDAWNPKNPIKSGYVISELIYINNVPTLKNIYHD